MAHQTPYGWVPRVGDKFRYNDRKNIYMVTEAPDLSSRERPLTMRALEESGRTPSVWNYNETYPFIWLTKKPIIIIQCKNL